MWILLSSDGRRLLGSTFLPQTKDMQLRLHFNYKWVGTDCLSVTLWCSGDLSRVFFYTFCPVHAGIGATPVTLRMNKGLKQIDKLDMPFGTGWIWEAGTGSVIHRACGMWDVRTITLCYLDWFIGLIGHFCTRSCLCDHLTCLVLNKACQKNYSQWFDESNLFTSCSMERRPEHGVLSRHSECLALYIIK